MYCMYAYISYIIYLASTSSASAGFFASSLLVISFTKSDCTSARRDWKLERSSLRTYIIHIEIYLIPAVLIVDMRKPKLSSLLVNLESHFHTYIHRYIAYIQQENLHEALHGAARDHIGLSHFIGDERSLSEELLRSQSDQLLLPTYINVYSDRYGRFTCIQ